MKERKDDIVIVALGSPGGAFNRRPHVIRNNLILHLEGNFKEAPSCHQPKPPYKGQSGLFAAATCSLCGDNMNDIEATSTKDPAATSEGKEKVAEEEDIAQGVGGRVHLCRYGLISVMGRRREMHDAVTAVPAVVELGGGRGRYDFFAVYDGQGGAAAASRCRARMHELLVEEAPVETEKERAEYWETVMRGCFGKMDEELIARQRNGDDGGGEEGTTALVVVVGEREIAVANCGDSRVVLGRAGVAVPLSRDHKVPNTEDEGESQEVGGRQVRNWEPRRFPGIVATSRSTGESSSRPCLPWGPEVGVTERTQVDELLVIATNGVWDAISNEDACGIAKSFLGGRCLDPDNANQAALVLAKLAVARGSKDNITVIVVDLKL